MKMWSEKHTQDYHSLRKLSLRDSKVELYDLKNKKLVYCRDVISDGALIQKVSSS